jgi:ATP-binding cassette subfamily B protein
VFEVLDMPSAVIEKPEATALGTVEGQVTFENVRFRYGGPAEQGLESVRRYDWRGMTREDSTEPAEPTEERWALRDLDFTIEPGETIALVGPSGAGKTTTTYLVPRLYDATEGAVRIDGVDVRDLRLSAIADAVGVVTQESYLFHDTIDANIRYSKPEATEAEIRAAAEAANIHDFISGLSGGYETVVGERGYRLSGGEKQRLAIARVLLKDPRILILDEATSHLDAHSEALIQEALEHVMRGRTSLVIAHRLSTVQNADRIVVLHHGEVREQGTHEELLALGGLYARLHELQFATAVAG